MQFQSIFSSQYIHDTLSLSIAISVSNTIEMIKSRIQIMNQLFDRGSINSKYQGFLDCAKTIKSNQGFRALWKGNSISLLRFFPNQKLNNEVKNYIGTKLPVHPITNIISGVSGGWTAAAIMYPFDTIRIFISTSTKKPFETSKQILKKIKIEGVKYLYKGYHSSLLNIALYRGTYFGIFDTFKSRANKESQKWFVAYLSSLAGGLIVYPTQTIRKKKIVCCNVTKYKQIIKKTYQSEGIKGFYRGCTLTPLQSLIGALVLMYFEGKKSQN